MRCVCVCMCLLWVYVLYMSSLNHDLTITSRPDERSVSGGELWRHDQLGLSLANSLYTEACDWLWATCSVEGNDDVTAWRAALESLCGKPVLYICTCILISICVLHSCILGIYIALYLLVWGWTHKTYEVSYIFKYSLQYDFWKQYFLNCHVIGYEIMHDIS